MDKDFVIETIKEAFMMEKYPGDDFLSDTSDTYERDLIEQNFIGKFWQDMDKEFMLKNRDSIYFFSKYGFKYYLPGFLLAIIEDFDELDTLPDIIVGMLSVPEKEDIIELYTKVKSYPKITGVIEINFDELEETMLKSFEGDKQWKLERLNEFNKEQCIAIKMFLEYMKKYKDELYESNNPEIVLERYWSKY